jgi:type VI secretion system protein VasD
VFLGFGRFNVKWFVAVCVCFILYGCPSSGLRSGERPELPRPLSITIGTTDRVNPSVSGRPSPIVVRIFELSNDTRFLAADYFELTGQDMPTLGGDVLASDEYSLIPTQIQIVERKAASGSKFLGIVAAYRDPSASVWRGIVPLPEPYLAGRLWSNNVSPTWRQTFVLDDKGVIIRRDDKERGPEAKP